MTPLVVCAKCDRHIHNDEHACPFCGAPLAEVDRARVAADTGQRLSRAALFVFGTAVAAGACGSEVTTSTAASSGAGSGGGSTNASSGSSPATTAASGTGGKDMSTGSAAMYGGPPVTSTGTGGAGGAGGAGGKGGADGSGGAGGFTSLYGSPPPE